MLQSMSQIDFYRPVLMAFPVIFSGILHMIFLKMQWLNFLAVPIHQRWFGANKTWRGFILMPLFTILGVYFVFGFSSDSTILGWCLGLGYVLFELPNSFLKRRLGIPPGQAAQKGASFFFWLDRLDSSIGCAFVYYLFGLDLWSVILFIPTGVFIHLGVTFMLKTMQLKESL